MNVVDLNTKRNHQPQDHHRRSIAKQKFAWIDRILVDQEITHLAFRVAVLIGRYLNHTSGDAWPKQATLAAELGVTTRGIQVALDALVAAGYLTVDVSKGRGHTNRYRPIFEPVNANGGSSINEQKDEQGFAITTSKIRTDAPENTNGGSKKHERPFVQNSSKRTLPSNSERESTRPPARMKSKTGWPEGFQLKPEHIAYAASKNVSQAKAIDMFERFRNNHIAKGSEFANWDFAWKSWVDKEPQFAGREVPDRNRIDDRL